MSERGDTTNISSADGKNLGDALTLAADILSSTGMAVPSPTTAEPLLKRNPETNEHNTAGSSPGAPSGSSFESIAALLPMFIQAMSGSANLIKPERLDLINALKPYLSQSRSESIDRAIRMANITKAAKSALGILGR
ncbi:MAG: hypothetical protein IIY11_07820 [Clostridia bacterium]|nr:hypothetical protein [Clostridia bacterium]